MYTIVENYGNTTIHPHRVDAVVEGVAARLGVSMDPQRPRVRVLVVSPEKIQQYRAGAEAVYFPGGNLMMVPYFDCSLWAHEMAHYLSDQYLRLPSESWESTANRIERQMKEAECLRIEFR